MYLAFMMKTIVLRRESVSMGDDAFDHTLEIEIEDGWTISQVLESIIGKNYLPKIQGGHATWSVAYDKPLAVLAQQWDKPRLIVNAYYLDYSKHFKIDTLHFNYHAQIDPDIVYRVLQEFKTAI
jgi:hypothetical protein